MGTITTPHILLLLIGLGLCILFLKPAEKFHWKSRADTLPWGGWDQLVLPNPLRRPPLPPLTGGESWQEPLRLAYGGAPTLNCNNQRRNTC